MLGVNYSGWWFSTTCSKVSQVWLFLRTGYVVTTFVKDHFTTHPSERSSRSRVQQSGERIFNSHCSSRGSFLMFLDASLALLNPLSTMRPKTTTISLKVRVYVKKVGEIREGKQLEVWFLGQTNKSCFVSQVKTNTKIPLKCSHSESEIVLFFQNRFWFEKVNSILFIETKGVPAEWELSGMAGHTTSGDDETDSPRSLEWTKVSGPGILCVGQGIL